LAVRVVAVYIIIIVDTVLLVVVDSIGRLLFEIEVEIF